MLLRRLRNPQLNKPTKDPRILQEEIAFVQVRYGVVLVVGPIAWTTPSHFLGKSSSATRRLRRECAAQQVLATASGSFSILQEMFWTAPSGEQSFSQQSYSIYLHNQKGKSILLLHIIILNVKIREYECTINKSISVIYVRSGPQTFPHILWEHPRLSNITSVEPPIAAIVVSSTRSRYPHLTFCFNVFLRAPARWAIWSTFLHRLRSMACMGRPGCKAWPAHAGHAEVSQPYFNRSDAFLANIF